MTPMWLKVLINTHRIHFAVLLEILNNTKHKRTDRQVAGEQRLQSRGSDNRLPTEIPCDSINGVRTLMTIVIVIVAACSLLL